VDTGVGSLWSPSRGPTSTISTGDPAWSGWLNF
jgi:hypothetical protein